MRLLAREADVVLVLGSQNSSNSQRLAELASETGVPAYLIDGPADIDPGWFQPDRHRADHRRSQRAGECGRRVRELAARALRRNG